VIADVGVSIFVAERLAPCGGPPTSGFRNVSSLRGDPMVVQEDVLRFVADRSDRRLAVSFADLTREFNLDPGSAVDHLERAWRDRLIQTVSDASTPVYAFDLIAIHIANSGCQEQD
jgi:hypothetical protein